MDYEDRALLSWLIANEENREIAVDEHYEMIAHGQEEDEDDC